MKHFVGRDSIPAKIRQDYIVYVFTFRRAPG
jgi:hypothetical protein